MALAPLYPETLMLGLELRIKVSDYVQDRIRALRHQKSGHYGNVACLRTNAMKYLPNYFEKQQVFFVVDLCTLFLHSMVEFRDLK